MVPHTLKKMELTSKKKLTSKATDAVNTATSIQMVKYAKSVMLPARMGKLCQCHWHSVGHLTLTNVRDFLSKLNKKKVEILLHAIKISRNCSCKTKEIFYNEKCNEALKSVVLLNCN